MQKFTEKSVSSKTIFEGKVFTVTLDEAELVNGAVHTREVVHHNGGAGILAINEKAEVALVRQYRYAVGKELIEIPAGKIEKGEDPRTAAIRELSEEAGLTAARFEAFGSILPTCAYCTEVIWLFLATGLTKTQQHLDEDEFVDCFWLPLTEAVAQVMDGRITDAKTVSALLRAQLLLAEGKINIK